MENLAEYIIPLIIAGIYFFSNLLSKKSKKNEPDTYEHPTWVPPDQDEYEVADYEFIPESDPQLTAYETQQLERRQAAHAHREERNIARHGTLPPPLQETVPPPLPEEAPDNAYASTIEQQLKRIAETERKAARIKKQAGGLGAPMKGAKHSLYSPKFSGSIRSQLQDPAAARAAFIFGEILGPSVSSGEQNKIPGLS